MGVNYFQRSAAASSHEAGARINGRRLVSLEMVERFDASLGGGELDSASTNSSWNQHHLRYVEAVK